MSQHQMTPNAIKIAEGFEIWAVLDCLDFLVSHTPATIIPTNTTIIEITKSSGISNFPLNMRSLVLPSSMFCGCTSQGAILLMMTFAGLYRHCSEAMNTPFVVVGWFGVLHRRPSTGDHLHLTG
jgi:hypothetical protein